MDTGDSKGYLVGSMPTHLFALRGIRYGAVGQGKVRYGWAWFGEAR